MKQINVTVSDRTGLGRTAARHLRQAGQIPAVLYGESGVRHLQLDAHKFQFTWREIGGAASLLQLKTEEGSEGEPIDSFAVIQEVQRDPRTDKFVHLDFREIVRGKDMELDIPVDTVGVADGVKNFGGVLEQNVDTLRVRCRPRDLPEKIVVDVTALEIGKVMHLEEITAPEGVTFLDDSDLVIVSCVGAGGGDEEDAEGDEEAVTAEA